MRSLQPSFRVIYQKNLLVMLGGNELQNTVRHAGYIISQFYS